jgi:NADPH:quinone reductase-like Zn-dependent oxidoreductase
MRAVVQTAYGSPEVLEIREVARPVPKVGEVLVEIRATTVSSGDVRMRSFDVPALFWLPGRLALGLTRPRQAIPGASFAGVVAEVGEGVTDFALGDRVFGLKVGGAHAQYMRVPQAAAMAKIPAGLSDAEAAALPFGAITALHFLQVGKVGPGTRILINGATGAVGSAAVQIAAHWGAEVTAVCSRKAQDLAFSLGADRVIDYRTTPVFGAGEVYDVVLDTTGAITPADCGEALRMGGMFLAVVTEIGTLTRGLKGRKTIGGVANGTRAHMAEICRLVEAGALKPMVDSTFSLGDVRAAHRRVEEGGKHGAVVLTVAA